MSIIVSSVLTRARTLLSDAQSWQRWSDTQLLGFASDGQRAIVAVYPAAAPLKAVVALVSGIRQPLPNNAYKLIAAYRNTDASGNAAGPALTRYQRPVLDTQQPTWQTTSPVAQPVGYIYDNSDPQAFYVYPPADGTGHVEVNYAETPADFVTTSDSLTVRDMFATPLVDYVMWRAHMQDSDFSGGAMVAKLYLDSFTAFMAAAANATPTGGAS